MDNKDYKNMSKSELITHISQLKAVIKEIIAEKDDC